VTRWAPLVVGDLIDRSLVREALGTHRIDLVLHFAASAYVGESIVNPRKYFQNNVVNSLNLLDAMIDAGVERIVFSSSCATYGEPEQIPVTEASPQRPINPYGESKLFIERALHWYEQAYGLRWCAMRYFNAAGADPEGELGESHDPETHLIPLILDVALGRRTHIDVFGTDYPTPDGTAIRDYVHVTDLADAHVKALEYLVAGGPSQPMNLSNGRGYSIHEVIAAVEQVTGVPVATRACPRRPGDPPVLVGDASIAREVLGWVPSHSDLMTIVQTAWKWRSRLPRD